MRKSDMEKKKITVTMPIYEYESLIEAAFTDWQKKVMILQNELSQLSFENSVLKDIIADYEKEIKKYKKKRKWWQIWKRKK